MIGGAAAGKPRSAALPGPVIPVRLELWGCLATDLVTARVQASYAQQAVRWDVVETKEFVGPPCPIPREPKGALGYGENYEWKWAVFRVTAENADVSAA